MKKYGLKIIGIIIGILVGLIFAEIASRIYLSGKKYVSVGKYQAKGKTRPLTVKKIKDNNVIRIAFSGDSYTYGFGVEEQDTFPEVIERKLKDSGNNNIECLNFGYRGANVVKELKILQNKILNFSPDIIIHGFVMNDFTHPKIQKKNYEFYKKDKIKYRPFRKLEKHSKFLYFIDQAIFSIFGKTGKAQISNLTNLYSKENNPYFDIMINSLEELISKISQHKGIVAFFPHFIRNEPDHLFYTKSKGIVSSLCAKYNVDFIELLPSFSQKPYFKWWVHPQDHHPNKEAHNIIATRLIEALKNKI